MNKLIHIPDPAIGIQGVLDEEIVSSLPAARQLPATVVAMAGLELLYRRRNIRQKTTDLLSPDIGDGDILIPDIFCSTLESCVRDLQGSGNPVLEELLEKELKPLLSNRELLLAYTGLMVGG